MRVNQGWAKIGAIVNQSNYWHENKGESETAALVLYSLKKHVCETFYEYS